MRNLFSSVVAVFLLVGCGIQQSNSMIGEWVSPLHKTEWGEMISALSLRSDGTCTLRMSSTVEPDADPLVSYGSWRATDKTGGTIVWQNDKPDAGIAISLVNSTTITLSSGEDVVTFKKMK